jgi:formate/nitrite transporter FocA (FNT family)
MFFVPTAIFHGDPMISTSFYIWKSLIPALIGNIVGGGLLVGVFFWYLVCHHHHLSFTSLLRSNMTD